MDEMEKILKELEEIDEDWVRTLEEINNSCNDTFDID